MPASWAFASPSAIGAATCSARRGCIGPACSISRKRLALDELHADVGLRLRLTEVVDGDDGGMIERGGRACLELEPPQPLGVIGQLGRQKLQRDVTIELRVAGEIDLAHAAGTEERANDVRPETRAGCQRHRGCYCARPPVDVIGIFSRHRGHFFLIIPACAGFPPASCSASAPRRSFC